jgi:hypothetical protein
MQAARRSSGSNLFMAFFNVFGSNISMNSFFVMKGLGQTSSLTENKTCENLVM